MSILKLMRITKLGLYNPFLFFLFALLVSFYFLNNYIALERPVLFDGFSSIAMAFMMFFYFLILDLFYIYKINNALISASNEVFSTSGKHKEFILCESLKTFLNDIGGAKFLRRTLNNECSLCDKIKRIIRVKYIKFKTTLNEIIEKENNNG